MNGDSFRDRVADILRARYGQADVERKVGGKDADIVFSFAYPGGHPIRVAVECKDWARPLQSKQITNIYSEYIPAFNNNEIDSLWIVARKPIRAEQKETTRTYGIKLRIFSIEELVHQIIDFSSYMNHLIEEFRKDDLDDYYIMPRTNDGTRLHEDIAIRWLKKDGARPIAIIAEYGAGKTSYAKYLAAWLAKRALDDLLQPKPILLQLGNLTRQQSIRGLINNLFSDEFNIEGYSYRLFNLLLGQGSFVVILDGFDEMKHAMRSRDIVANLNMLRDFMKNKRSKFMLLGRPDPFTTIQDEFALKGGVTIGTQIIDDNTTLKFDIFGLAEFSDDELDAFLRAFLVSKTRNSGIGNKKAYIDARLQDIKTMNISSVVRKPVHAKMLGVLTAAPNWKIESTSEYDLFDHFVAGFLRRELSEKEARATIPESQRRQFMEKIAWWLWTKKKRISFSSDEVPDQVISSARGFFESGESKENIVREMLIGSILSRSMSSDLVVAKDAFSFYFPHKSYWEFLVAEYIASGNFRAVDTRDFVQGITLDVLKFLSERNNRGFLERLCRLLISYKDALVPFGFIEQFSGIVRWNSDEVARNIDRLGEGGLILAAAALSGGHASFEYFRGKFGSVGMPSSVSYRLGVMLFNLIVGERVELDDEMKQHALDIDALLFMRIIELIGFQTLLSAQYESSRQKQSSRLHVPPHVGESNARIFNDAIEFHKGGGKIIFHPSIIASVLKVGVIPYIDIGALIGRNIITIDARDFIKRYVGPNLRNAFERFLNGKKPEVIVGSSGLR
jgi:hypothetical protein